MPVHRRGTIKEQAALAVKAESHLQAKGIALDLSLCSKRGGVSVRAQKSLKRANIASGSLQTVGDALGSSAKVLRLLSEWRENQVPVPIYVGTETKGAINQGVTEYICQNEQIGPAIKVAIFDRLLAEGKDPSFLHNDNVTAASAWLSSQDLVLTIEEDVGIRVVWGEKILWSNVLYGTTPLEKASITGLFRAFERYVGKGTRGIRHWDSKSSGSMALPDEFFDSHDPRYADTIGDVAMMLLRGAALGQMTRERHELFDHARRQFTHPDTFVQQAWVRLGIRLSTSHSAVLSLVANELHRAGNLDSASSSPAAFLTHKEHLRAALSKSAQHPYALANFNKVIIPAVEKMEQNKATSDLPDLLDGLTRLRQTAWSLVAESLCPYNQPYRLYAISGNWEDLLDEYEMTSDPAREAELENKMDALVDESNDATLHCQADGCPCGPGGYGINQSVKSPYPEDTRQLCLADGTYAAFALRLGLSFEDFHAQEVGQPSYWRLRKQVSTIPQLLALVQVCQSPFCADALPACSSADTPARVFGGILSSLSRGCAGVFNTIYRNTLNDKVNCVRAEVRQLGEGGDGPPLWEIPPLPVKDWAYCYGCGKPLPPLRRYGDFGLTDETGAHEICLPCCKTRVASRGGVYRPHLERLHTPEGRHTNVTHLAPDQRTRIVDVLLDPKLDDRSRLDELSALCWIVVAPDVTPLHAVFKALSRTSFRAIEVDRALRVVQRIMEDKVKSGEAMLGDVDEEEEEVNQAATIAGSSQSAYLVPSTELPSSLMPASAGSSSHVTSSQAPMHAPISAKGKGPALPRPSPTAAAGRKHPIGSDDELEASPPTKHARV